MNDGYAYAVCGPVSFLEEAITSAASLKRVDERAHATLITTPSLYERGMDADVFDHVVKVEHDDADGKDVDWQTGLSFKASVLYEHSPYERTFFVDSDTYFIDNCRGLFDLLEPFSICLPKVPKAGNPYQFGDDILEGYTSYSSGLILFNRSDEIQRAFEQWRMNFEEETFWGDQRALTYTLAEVGIAPYVIPNNWHAVFGSIDGYSGRVHFLHGRHDDLSYIADRINETEDRRAWLPFVETCVYRGMGTSGVLNLVSGLGRGAKRKLLGYLDMRDDPRYQTATQRDTSLR